MDEEVSRMLSNAIHATGEEGRTHTLRLLWFLQWQRQIAISIEHEDHRQVYLDFVPSSLLDKRLDLSAQKEIVKIVFSKLLANPDNPELIAAIGAGSRELVLPELLDFIGVCGHALGEFAAQSVFTALRNYLSPNPDCLELESIGPLLRAKDPTPFLERELNWRSDRDSALAERTRAMVVKYLRN